MTAKVNKLIMNRCHLLQSPRIHHKTSKIFHNGAFNPRTEVEMSTLIQIPGTVSCNDGQVLSGGLDEVHGRHVGDGLSIGREEEV